MNIRYLIYKIFETKWKKVMFNIAELHLWRAHMIRTYEHGDNEIEGVIFHIKESLDYMDLIA